MSGLAVINGTRASIPRADFRAIKDHILGESYELNLIFTTAAKIKKLNKMYRDIDKPTDILSFPISKDQGEMYICLSETRKEAKKFDRSYENFVPFLFIHGCVHLKGYDHGATMERIEVRARKAFKI